MTAAEWMELMTVEEDAAFFAHAASKYPIALPSGRMS
jgi:hypothetical protein